jgi:hypothetical protein
MAKSNTRKYIIWGSGAVLIGAIGYMLWKKYRKPKEETKVADVTPDGSSNQTQTQTQTQSTSSNTATITKNPFSTKEELDLFQTWVYNVKGDKNILGASKIDGLWGPSSATAWDKYGEEYKKYQKANQDKNSADSKIATQKTVNKQNMDALVNGWNRSPAAKIGTINGRSLKLEFEPNNSWNDSHFWNITFYENTNGKSSPTYTIGDGTNKLIGSGYWTYSKTVGYKLTTSSGVGKRPAPYTDGSLVPILKAIIGRSSITWKK